MIQRRLIRTNVPRLGPCLAALRALAKSNDPHRSILVERRIDEYLRTDPFSLAHALERLRKAIHYEEERRDGGDWSVAKGVRSLAAKQDGVATTQGQDDQRLVHRRNQRSALCRPAQLLQSGEVEQGWAGGRWRSN